MRHLIPAFFIFLICLVPLHPVRADDHSAALRELEKFRSLILSGDELVEKNDMDAAVSAYENDIETADTPIVEIVALQRLARILAYTKKPDQALERLGKADLRLHEAFGPDHVYRIDIMKTGVMAFSYLGNREKGIAAQRVLLQLVQRYADAWVVPDSREFAVHRQSGAMVPGTLGPMKMLSPVVFEIDGSDVSVGYKTAGMTMTVYFTKTGTPEQLKPYFEQARDVMMMQYRSSPDATLIEEGRIASVVPTMPGNGHSAVAEYTPPGGKKTRSSLHVLHDGTWSIKVRFSYLTEVAATAEPQLSALWHAMKWPTTD